MDIKTSSFLEKDLLLLQQYLNANNEQVEDPFNQRNTFDNFYQSNGSSTLLDEQVQNFAKFFFEDFCDTKLPLPYVN
jgi:hypothetical protein